MSDASINQRFTDHATKEMIKRGVTMEQVQAVLATPAQAAIEESGRVVYQGPVELHRKTMLLRVVTFVHEELGVKTLTIITVIPAKMGRYGS